MRFLILVSISLLVFSFVQSDLNAGCLRGGARAAVRASVALPLRIGSRRREARQARLEARASVGASYYREGLAYSY